MQKSINLKSFLVKNNTYIIFFAMLIACICISETFLLPINLINIGLQQSAPLLVAVGMLFVIMTDGLENASTRWTYAQLQRLIEQEKEGHGWEFLFLGANMDAVKEASRLGIAPERTSSFINDSEGIEINFRCVSKAMKYFRACEELDESGWKAEIEHDQCRRG